MPASLLVPFDSTDGARRALELADVYATRAELRIDLLVVGSEGLEDDDRADLRREAAHLRAGVGDLLVITSDDVAESIGACAAGRRDSTVWMATHGRSRIGGLFLGGTAEAVVRSSGRPMVLIGPHVPSDPSSGPVVVCVASDAPPTSLLAAARWWADRLECPLRGVTVGRPDGDDLDQCERALDRFARRAARDGIPIDTTVLTGDDPAEIIRQYAEREGVRLVAMATHARAGVRRAVLGSVTMAVVHHAPCPTLVQAADET